MLFLEWAIKGVAVFAGVFVIYVIARIIINRISGKDDTTGLF